MPKKRARTEHVPEKKFSEVDVGAPFAWPEGEGRLYKREGSQLSVRYHPSLRGELIVELAGELDVYSAPSLRTLLIEAVKNRYFNLILSFEGLEFLDSTGLGVLVGALKRVRAHDGQLRLVCTQERLLRIFRITGLTKVYCIYDTIPEALTASAESDDIADRNLLFQVYIPSACMYATEAGRLLALFRDWLTATRGQGIRQSGYRTAAGEMYEFFAAASAIEIGLHEQLDRFANFLTLCADNQSAAVSVLAEMNLSRQLSSDLVSRFSREVRRLEVDLRHERERRVLSLRHTLEQELVENDIDVQQLPSGQLSALLESLIPGSSPSVSLALVAGSDTAVQPQSVTVNFNPQIISALESTIVQNVQGIVNLSSEAKKIFAVIDQFGGNNKIALRSAVYELEDADAPPVNRSAARLRLKQFIDQLVGTAHEVGLSLLEKYLEKKLGI